MCDLFSDEAVAAQTARHVRMLQELAEIGMNVARAVGRQVLAEPEPAEPAGTAHPELVLTRIARCVRQTVALEARLTADYRAWAAKSSAEQAAALAERAERAEAAEARRRERRKAQVERAAKTVIEGATRPDDYHYRLRDVKEWLWDSDDDADFADRPIGEIIARICADLDIPFEAAKWANQSWAREEIRTKAPASPFVPIVPAADAGEKPGFRGVDPPVARSAPKPAARRRPATGRDPP
jgi:hypothetical protein